MTRNALVLVTVFLALSTQSASAAQSQASETRPTVRIVEPQQDVLLAPDQILRVVIEPEASAVIGVSFLVDGIPACQVTRRPFECRHLFGDLSSAHTVRAVATLLGGERITATIRTARSILESTGVTAVNVPVVVKDYREHFVKGLTTDSFRVFENDVPQSITLVASENVPIDVVIAIDISNSMSSSMPKLKATVKQFLRELAAVERSNTEVKLTVLAFNDRAFVVSKPGDSLEARIAETDKLSAFGGTSLFDALLKSLDLLGSAIGSRKVIIAFTDGDDQASLTSIEPVEQRIKTSDATIYMITQGRGARMEAARGMALRIAKLSGGSAYSLDKIDQLKELLREVIDDFTHQYLIGYSPSNAAPDGTYRTIVVKTKRGSDVIRARDGYQAKARGPG